MNLTNSRLLAVVGGIIAILASLMFSLSVSRRLSPSDLAILNLVNSAYAIGTAIMAYITGWYPRV